MNTRSLTTLLETLAAWAEQATTAELWLAIDRLSNELHQRPTQGPLDPAALAYLRCALTERHRGQKLQ